MPDIKILENIDSEKIDWFKISNVDVILKFIEIIIKTFNLLN